MIPGGVEPFLNKISEGKLRQFLPSRKELNDNERSACKRLKMLNYFLFNSFSFILMSTCQRTGGRNSAENIFALFKALL